MHVLTILGMILLFVRRLDVPFINDSVRKVGDIPILFTIFWMVQFHTFLLLNNIQSDGARYPTVDLGIISFIFVLFMASTPWLVYIHAYYSSTNERPEWAFNLSFVAELFGFVSVGLSIGLA